MEYKIIFIILIALISILESSSSIRKEESKFNFKPEFKSNFFGFNPASKSFPQSSSDSSSSSSSSSSSYRSEDKKVIKISNKVGRGISVVCNIISENWTFLDSKSSPLDVNESLVMKVGRDENELFPWIKCVAIWFPDSVGFMAFNALNTPASNNNIVITSPGQAFLVKGKRKSKLQSLE